MVSYRIDVSATHAHTFAVELVVQQPASEVNLSLPVWIPGSYLVREFARHVSAMSAAQGERAVTLQQLDKASWRMRCEGNESLVVRYRVYAFDPSVRSCFLDAERGFFNGTGVFLRVTGREHEAHAVSLAGVPGGWSVATTLAPRDADAGASARDFVAADYDELVDHPVELGRFWRGTFVACDVPHEFVVAGALPDFDGERLLADTKRVCETEIAFWHGSGRAPFERYLFMLNALDDSRGGLEHRSSTALVAPRRSLPRRGAATETNDAYVDLLGLISHEYFHSWNVKRLKPREFAAFDYTRENYTELLWFFEGFTSYYDDLFLLRSGLVDAPRYLKLLGKSMSAVDAAPGRAVQSVAQASFDAWVKYYRADENTPNATISYYAKGSLVALALDLTLRAESHKEGRGSLDEVMRRLWRTSGGGTIDEADIAAALEAVGGRSYAPELAAWVHGVGELPLEALLQRFGVAFARQPATFAQRLGLRATESAFTGVKVTHVLRDGAAEQAGLAAGDELIAAGDWRVRRLDDVQRCFDGAAGVVLTVGRDQRLVRIELDSAALAGADSGAIELKLAEAPAAEARGLYEAWIAG